MASKTTHLKQAEHNKILAEQLLPNEHYDWSCTIAFYAAVHFVEAKFTDIPEIQHTEKVYKEHRLRTVGSSSSSNGTLTEHLIRERSVNGRFPTIKTEYRHLMEVSMQARYLHPADKVACDQIQRSLADRLVKTDLPKIKIALAF